MKFYKALFISALIIGMTLMSNCIFFDWVYNTLYDASELEARAHQHYANQRYEKAYHDFTQSAELSDQIADKTRRLNFAATSAYTVLDFSRTLKNILRVLKVDPINERAIDQLKNMLKHKQANLEQVQQLPLKTRILLGLSSHG